MPDPGGHEDPAYCLQLMRIDTRPQHRHRPKPVTRAVQRPDGSPAPRARGLGRCGLARPRQCSSVRSVLPEVGSGGGRRYGVVPRRQPLLLSQPPSEVRGREQPVCPSRATEGPLPIPDPGGARQDRGGDTGMSGADRHPNSPACGALRGVGQPSFQDPWPSPPGSTLRMGIPEVRHPRRGGNTRSARLSPLG